MAEQKQGQTPYFNIEPSELLEYQVQKNIKILFKEYLYIMEKVVKEHIDLIDKLKDSLPDQYKTYVDLADFLTDSKYEELRKEILDRGNATIRNTHEEMSKFKVEFKKQ